MKIFQIISSLGNGGAEKLVVELSNELSQNENVTLISLKKIESWMFFPKKLNKNVQLIQLTQQKGFHFKVFLHLYILLKKEKPDVVHVHLNMALYYTLILIPLFPKIQFIHTIHSMFEPHKKLFNKLKYLPYYKRVLNVCLSNSIKTRFKKSFPELPFSTIENGVSEMKITPAFEAAEFGLDLFRIDSSTKLILFIGSLSYAKNIPLLINVFKELLQHNVKLIIIGKGDIEMENLLSNKCTTSNNIFYMGPKENIADYMKLSDALILTSRYEGMPIVVLEALSIGLPILSTPVGGMVDIVQEGKNGFLSKSQSKEDILEIVEKFLSLDENMINQIKTNNGELFKKRYSMKTCANKYLDLYRNHV